MACTNSNFMGLICHCHNDCERLDGWDLMAFSPQFGWIVRNYHLLVLKTLKLELKTWFVLTKRCKKFGKYCL